MDEQLKEAAELMYSQYTCTDGFALLVETMGSEFMPSDFGDFLVAIKPALDALHNTLDHDINHEVVLNALDVIKYLKYFPPTWHATNDALSVVWRFLPTLLKEEELADVLHRLVVYSALHNSTELLTLVIRSSEDKRSMVCYEICRMVVFLPVPIQYIRSVEQAMGRGESVYEHLTEEGMDYAVNNGHTHLWTQYANEKTYVDPFGLITEHAEFIYMDPEDIPPAPQVSIGVNVPMDHLDKRKIINEIKTAPPTRRAGIVLGALCLRFLYSLGSHNWSGGSGYELYKDMATISYLPFVRESGAKHSPPHAWTWESTEEAYIERISQNLLPILNTSYAFEDLKVSQEEWKNQTEATLETVNERNPEVSITETRTKLLFKDFSKEIVHKNTVMNYLQMFLTSTHTVLHPVAFKIMNRLQPRPDRVYGLVPGAMTTLVYNDLRQGKMQSFEDYKEYIVSKCASTTIRGYVDVLAQLLHLLVNDRLHTQFMDAFGYLLQNSSLSDLVVKSMLRRFITRKLWLGFQMLFVASSQSIQDDFVSNLKPETIPTPYYNGTFIPFSYDNGLFEILSRFKNAKTRRGLYLFFLCIKIGTESILPLLENENNENKFFIWNSVAQTSARELLYQITDEDTLHMLKAHEAPNAIAAFLKN
jgi:hypothetical protein